MNKLWYIHIREYYIYSNEKEWSSSTHNNVDESHKYNTEQKKLDMVWFLLDGEEKQAKLTYAIWSRGGKQLEGRFKGLLVLWMYLFCEV